MDILTALDSGSGAVLLMLDLSAAFDTIDHGILLSRLNSLYGISGDALDWFKSYLSSRVQRVFIGDTVSECKDLNFGVPQGSVLGPKIYCMYTKPISDIIAGHGLSHHCYADDTQLYIAIEHSANLHSELLRMERCVADIRNWMRHNMLKLNDDKTELIVFASRYNQHLYSDASMMIGNTTIVYEPQVKNLGVIFDQVMSMRQHVNYTSRTARFHFRNISRIRRYIPGIMQISGAVVSHLTTRLIQWFAIWNPEICSFYLAVCSKFCCSYCHQDCSEGTYYTCSQRATLVAGGQEN